MFLCYTVHIHSLLYSTFTQLYRLELKVNFGTRLVNSNHLNQHIKLYFSNFVFNFNGVICISNRGALIPAFSKNVKLS